MAISKIILNNSTQMDITSSTITPNTVLDGYVGYASDGTQVIGNAVGGSITQDENGALIFGEDGSDVNDSVGSITGIGSGSVPTTFQIKIRGFSSVPTGDVVFNFPYAYVNFGGIFYNTLAGSNGRIKLTLNAKTTPTTTGNSLGSEVMDLICYQATCVREVVFNVSGQDYVQLGNYSFQTTSARGSQGVEIISGTPISLWGGPGSTYTSFKYDTALKEVRFYENGSNPASGRNLYFDTCSGLSDDTLVSLANGLHVPNEGVTLTLNLHATPKARLSSIMGYVRSVTRDEETYDNFVALNSGDTTLQDFITNTKGWTIA